jgi:hypothetical protein
MYYRLYISSSLDQWWPLGPLAWDPGRCHPPPGTYRHWSWKLSTWPWRIILCVQPVSSPLSLKPGDHARTSEQCLHRWDLRFSRRRLLRSYVAACSLVDIDRRFRRVFCLHHEGDRPDNYTVQHPRWHQSSLSSSLNTSEPGKWVSSISFNASSPDNVYSSEGGKRGLNLTLGSLARILWSLPALLVSLTSWQKIIQLTCLERLMVLLYLPWVSLKDSQSEDTLALSVCLNRIIMFV